MGGEGGGTSYQSLDNAGCRLWSRRQEEIVLPPQDKALAATEPCVWMLNLILGRRYGSHPGASVWVGARVAQHALGFSGGSLIKVSDWQSPNLAPLPWEI